jgi:hypothetical protein
MNYADYWKKHHPESHHRNIQKKFLKPTIVIKMLRIEQTTTTKGCARSMIFDRSSIYAKDGG